jgi:hypothetical protein
MAATQRITRDDIKTKLEEIQGDATQTVEDARSKIIAVGVAVGAVVLVGVFLLGRRGGRRQTTVIELKRT